MLPCGNSLEGALTPLAHRLAKELTLPARKRDFPMKGDPSEVAAGVRKVLEDIHCFECTAVLPMLPELQQLFERQSEEENDRWIGRLSFLPAPRTWIEVKLPYGRIAFHLSLEHPHDIEKWIGALIVCDGGMSPIGLISRSSADVQWPGGNYAVPAAIKQAYDEGRLSRKQVDDIPMGWLALCQMLLLLINTPRIIGRRQHMPHRGLESSLVRSLGRGSFPLHAWTEIMLQVHKPTEIDDGEPHEAHLTGRRALHFCRAHLRIRLGQLEYVTSHWRGDPAIGIRQSRYKVTA
jgi:hypothetical protein